RCDARRRGWRTLRDALRGPLRRDLGRTPAARLLAPALHRRWGCLRAPHGYLHGCGPGCLLEGVGVSRGAAKECRPAGQRRRGGIRGFATPKQFIFGEGQHKNDPRSCRSICAAPVVEMVKSYPLYAWGRNSPAQGEVWRLGIAVRAEGGAFWPR